MDEIIISILVPMYNAETTIEECLTKLLKQCGNTTEVVVLNDGSIDGCEKKAREFEKTNSRIRVYSQKNRGVAYTRQKLIDLARGEYIMFCDADDYFEDSAIDQVYGDIIRYRKENASPDVYIYGYNLVRSFGNKRIEHRRLTSGIYNKKECSREHSSSMEDLYWSALWNKCYKKEICLNPRIEFETMMEDVMFNIDFFSRCKNVYISSCVIYNYIQIGESLTRGKKRDNTESIKRAEEAYGKLYKKALNAYPEEKKIIVEHIYMLYSSLLDRAKKINDACLYMQIENQCKELRKELKLRVLKIQIKRLQIRGKTVLKKIIGR